MTATHWHQLFEVLAYAAGFQLYLWRRRRLPDAQRLPKEALVAVVCGAVVGASLGARLVALGGKTIVGGLLGGLLGVEIAKKLVKHPTSTGDAMVLPLMLGIAVGRVGCFLAGLEDNTYGVPTTLPWGVDFGDGVARHPTQLYEIAFLAALALAWPHLPRLTARSGDGFKAFMVAYLTFRLAVDFVKPYPQVFLGLGVIQLAAVAGLAYYARDVVRWVTRAPSREVRA